jgi:hypothetical protein
MNPMKIILAIRDAGGVVDVNVEGKICVKAPAPLMELARQHRDAICVTLEAEGPRQQELPAIAESEGDLTGQDAGPLAGERRGRDPESAVPARWTVNDYASYWETWNEKFELLPQPWPKALNKECDAAGGRGVDLSCALDAIRRHEPTATTGSTDDWKTVLRAAAPRTGQRGDPCVR